MGHKLTAPEVVLFSAADRFENSIRTNYDIDGNVWLANQFTAKVIDLVPTLDDLPFGGLLPFKTHHSPLPLIDDLIPSTSLTTLYESIYVSMSGSHLTVENEQKFSNAGEVGIEDFLGP